jgi:transposase
VVIVDNCRIHHTDEVLLTILSTGRLIVFLPPYSPFFNPIEGLFSIFKQHLRRYEEEWLSGGMSHIEAIYNAFRAVTPAHCKSLVQDAGYRVV